MQRLDPAYKCVTCLQLPARFRYLNLEMASAIGIKK